MTQSPSQSSLFKQIPSILRPVIDQAINETLEASAQKSSLPLGVVGRCADFAIVGARLLSKITGHPYRSVSGGAVVDCGNNTCMIINPSRRNRRDARFLSSLRDYHCWIESVHRMADGHARVEVVDFTLRHDAEYVHAHKKMFFNDRYPSYRWDFKDLIVPPPEDFIKGVQGAEKSQFWTWEIADCTRLLHAYECSHEVNFQILTNTAFLRFYQSLELLHKDLSSEAQPPKDL